MSGPFSVVGECRVCGAPYFIEAVSPQAEMPPEVFCTCLCLPQRGMRFTGRHVEEIVASPSATKPASPILAPHPKVDAEGNLHPSDHRIVVDMLMMADLGITKCALCGWMEHKFEPPPSGEVV